MVVWLYNMDLPLLKIGWSVFTNTSKRLEETYEQTRTCGIFKAFPFSVSPWGRDGDAKKHEKPERRWVSRHISCVSEVEWGRLIQRERASLIESQSLMGAPHWKGERAAASLRPQGSQRWIFDGATLSVCAHLRVFREQMGLLQVRHKLTLPRGVWLTTAAALSSRAACIRVSELLLFAAHDAPTIVPLLSPFYWKVPTSLVFLALANCWMLHQDSSTGNPEQTATEQRKVKYIHTHLCIEQLQRRCSPLMWISFC